MADLQNVPALLRDALDRRGHRWRVVRGLRFLFHTDRTRPMSETQNEYETEQETDAGITSGPWEVQDQPWEMDIVSGDYAVATVHGFAKDGTIEGNAALIAAAGTAAQEAKEMGYDPQKAVEALPKLLEALEYAYKEQPAPTVEIALASAEGRRE
jgi:hypothetical protein